MRRNFPQNLPSKHRGVVLVIALIVLVAMTMAGIALVRSVDTSNIIAGNLAFQQSATYSGDIGTETAIRWLEANSGGTTLHSDVNSSGYYASRANPGPNQTWDDFWENVLGTKVTLAEDTSGNTVSYVIHRLCESSGDPASVPTALNPGPRCAVAVASATSSAGNSEDSGTVVLLYSQQRYYRITSRIVGPRNTVSYVQAVVAL